MSDPTRHPRTDPFAGTRGGDATGATAPRDRTRRDGGERGFALLVSLIAIVGLTALATGGFFLADSERKTSSNHHASVEAYHLAEAGLNQFLGTVGGPPSTSGSYPYSYPGAEGDAEVFVERVGTTRDGQELYRIRSVGQFRPGGSSTAATREVGTVTVLNSGTIPTPPSAIASGGGISKNGSSGTISGVDQCGQTADRAAVRVPEDPGYIQSGGGDVLEGDPPADSVANPFDFIDSGQQWWESMIDGTGVPHDYTLKSDDSSANWPDFSTMDGDEMPVTYVDKNSIDLGDNQDGRGLLILRGDVNFKGNFDWEGIILVGGSVTDSGQGQIEGAMMTGLNTLIGEDVSQDDLEDSLDGTKKYLFDSCIVEAVQNATATLAGVPSTWHEEI